MKLFLVHCGFYDNEVGDGVYESHTNLFVVAKDFADARLKARANPIFQDKKMHVDGIQQVEAVDGFRVNLDSESALEGKTIVTSHKHRDLAPKPSPTTH
jgi:hypothetical protein